MLNVNNPPVCTTTSAVYTVPELSIAGTIVANLSGTRVSDKDGDVLVYAILYGNDDGLFAVGNASGRVVVGPSPGSGLVLDFERKASYVVVVQASDPGGLQCTAEVRLAHSLQYWWTRCASVTCLGSCALFRRPR